MNPQTLIFRPSTPDQDIPRILSLYNEMDLVDLAGMQVSEQAIRSQLELAGHDPLKDRWMVEIPGDPPTLIATAFIRVLPGENIGGANILVHPAWRHQGLGSDLLSRVQTRAQELHLDALQIYTDARHASAPGFLHKHDFFPKGAYTELRLAEGSRLPPVTWPFGYTLHSYSEVQNLSTLTEAMNLSYIPLWGHHEVSEQQMASWLADFNQDGLFLVFSEKGRVVGISRVEPSPERTQKNGTPTGYIDAPGIVPQHRRLDLYRALLLTGIRWLQAQGQVIIEMESWGDKLEVLKMYRELGFIDIRQLICYQKTLSSDQGSAPVKSS